MHLDSLNFIAIEHYRVEKKDEGLATFREAWELFREMPVATYVKKENGFEERMSMMLGNYIYALKLAGSEEAAEKVSAEVDQLKKRIAEASAEKKE